MGNTTAVSSATATIAAMITPALLILGSASLVASALVRMARVVDRARVLAALIEDGKCSSGGLTRDQLRAWLGRHAARARYAERSVLLLYSAVVVFVATCLSIALDRVVGDSLNWLPISLAIFGTLLLLAGGAWMVAESRLSGEQIQDEIHRALAQLEKDHELRSS
jgi:hypothetical protein